MIGLLGGTFDPPHLGHLLLAEAALEALDLERVLWILTPRSPLKGDVVPAPLSARLRLVEAAIADHPRFQLSRTDIDRSPPHYTADLLEILRQAEPGAGLAYLIGSDSLAELPRWHDPPRVVGLCDVLGVVERPGFPIETAALAADLPGIEAKVRRIPAPPVAISASDLRTRLSQGKSIRYQVPEAVRRLIEAERLYARAPA